MNNIKQLFNKAEKDMKNSADEQGCYPQARRRQAEVDNSLRDLHNSSYPTKAEFNNCSNIILSISPFTISLFFFPLTKNNTTSSPGFLGEWLNNLHAAGYNFDIIGSTFGQQLAAGYGEFYVWF